MERVQRIWEHPFYRQCLTRICELEASRPFCRHTPEHFLDVARLSWICSLEEQIPVKRPVIYAAALLHDIGRFRQYEDGTPHDQASLEIAQAILPECGFTPDEISQITGMIASHRQKGDTDPLHALFYRADKQSRCCFLCPVCGDCNWPEEKKNLTVNY